MKPVYRYITAVIFMLTVFLTGWMTACQSNSTGPEPEETGFDQGGLYTLMGTKITRNSSGTDKSTTAEAVADTSRINFTVNIAWNFKDRQNVRIIGLYGADAGLFGERVHNSCEISDDCKVFGSFATHEKIEINVENNGRTYKAQILVRMNDISLKGDYIGEDVMVEYDLTGELIQF